VGSPSETLLDAGTAGSGQDGGGWVGGVGGQVGRRRGSDDRPAYLDRVGGGRLPMAMQVRSKRAGGGDAGAQALDSGLFTVSSGTRGSAGSAKQVR
jgi:hypothetical protein